MKHFLLLSFCVVLIFLPVCRASAADVFREDRSAFFSPERLTLNEMVLDNTSDESGLKNDLASFAGNYNRGMDSIFGGDIENAKESFLAAREAWPEFFWTDLMLALIDEWSGDHPAAARYYKSYLNKLKDFHRGHYRISGPLIRSHALSGIERYEPARDIVRDRLEALGIDLDKVRPVSSFPNFFLPGAGLVSVLMLWALVRNRLIPYLRLRERVKHPPEGFWGCPGCGAIIPDLVKECAKCGKPKGAGKPKA
ncbi:MAG: hypothetical protein ABIA77_04135 [Candidatus Omnitrophota bacterium]